MHALLVARARCARGLHGKLPEERELMAIAEAVETSNAKRGPTALCLPASPTQPRASVASTL